MSIKQRFPCPALGGEVELTEERWHHIGARHPELVRRKDRDYLAEVLLDPDQVAPDPSRYLSWRLARWFPELMSGK